MSQPTIWKYRLEVADEIAIKMPAGALILQAEVQTKDTVYLWALVRPDNVMATRHFAVRGTGHPCEGLFPEMYVGTVHLHGGALVFHIFDRGRGHGCWR